MFRASWMKSIAVSGLVLMLALALAACGSEQAQSTPAAATEAAATEAAATEAAATEAAATEAAATEAAAAEAAAAEAAATEAAATEAAATEAAATEAAATEAAATEAAAETAGVALSFQIVPESSEARFLIDEVLMGQDKTVVGVTSQVSGEITVDPATLTTDDDRRTNRVRNDILRAGQADYQYIIFQPTAISGMPESVAEGQPFSFQLTGDLTILGIAIPVTFDMTVTPVSTSELTGSGSATIRWADFGISIPSVPMVAGVSDEVQLQIDFTAQATS